MPLPALGALGTGRYARVRNGSAAVVLYVVPSRAPTETRLYRSGG